MVNYTKSFHSVAVRAGDSVGGVLSNQLNNISINLYLLVIEIVVIISRCDHSAVVVNAECLVAIDKCSNAHGSSRGLFALCERKLSKRDIAVKLFALKLCKEW